MKLKKLILNNFQSYQNAEIDFENMKIISITGKYKGSEIRSNGSGKSTLLDAIIYPIFGKSRTKEEDDLIRENTEEMNVELHLELTNHEIMIINRGKSKKKNYLNLFINNIDKTTGKIETQEIIENKIGMDYELFVATLFFQQEGADKFTAATPTERKKYLKKLLNLEVYDRSYKETSEILKLLNMDITKLVSKIEYIDEQLEGKDLEKLNNDLELKSSDLLILKKDWERKYELKNTIEKQQIIINNLNKEKNEKEKKISILKDNLHCDQETFSRVKEDYNLNQEKLNKIEKIEESLLESLKIRGEEINKNIGKIESEIDSKNQQIQIFEDKNQNISKELICPFCDNNLDENYKQKIYDKNNSAINELIKEKKQLEIELNKKKTQLNATREDYKEKNNKIKLFKELDNERRLMILEINNLERDIKQSTNDIKDLEQKLKIIKKDIKDNEILDQFNQENIEKLSVDINEIEDEINDLKNEIKNFQENKKQKKLIKLNLEKLRWEYNCYTILKEAFGKNGVSADVIKESLNEIEERSNEILKQINNGEYRIFFDTVKKTKSGNLSDSLDIYIENNRSVRSYESYSGGQRAIINFSIRLALSKILSKLNNVAFGFVALDEVFGSLDEYNKEKMIYVINYLKPLFYQILVISHTDLKSCFENNIIIEYNQKTGISKISEII